jgi:thiol-disulfide isomerase/thioredoxin
MKHLRCFFFFFVLMLPFLSQSQDQSFTFNGKLQQPSSISSLLIAYPTRYMDSIPIQADGSFSYSGNFSEPGGMQIGVRATAVKVWLDSSLKNIYLSEKPDRNGKMKLTVDSVVGSEDTYLYYCTLLPGRIKIYDTPSYQRKSFYSQVEARTYHDSVNKARRPIIDSLFRLSSFKEIDSVFKIRSDSKVLPWLIRFHGQSLGMEFMWDFYYRLNTEQQQSESGKDLLNELNKLQLLKPGNVFEDFTMKNDHSRKFKFSSLKSKYVLIDFWASWCGPCRGNHPYLREAYLKTKSAGLEIISISLDEDRKKWLEAIKQDKLEWLNVSELNGRNNTIALKYKITGIPFSVLLDENRKIVLVNPSSYQLTEFFANLR